MSEVTDVSGITSEKEVVKDTKDLRDKCMRQIEMATRNCKPWMTKCEEITKRYRDKRGAGEGYGSASLSKRFNVLYSNIQTLQPAIYSRSPIPEIERRFKDKDVQARLSSEVLERSTDYCLQTYDFQEPSQMGVLDYLLSARGVARVVYEFEKEMVENPQMPGEMIEHITKEKSKIKYVNREDFLHSPDRIWSEISWQAFRSYMTKDELTERFGKEIAAEIKLIEMTHGTDEEQKDIIKKAQVWEFWDKKTKTVSWVTKGYDDVLDSKPDFLELHNFFPAPRPLYGVLSPDSLIPTPDFCYYEDQAKELDALTTRISLLIRALRVAGLYDAAAKEIDKLLADSTENKLLPVRNWAQLVRDGGVENLVSWMPIEQIAKVVVQLYEARDKTLSEIYEITGISDIIRGTTVASETATAQQIKGQFATLRINTRQKEVSRWLKELIELKAQIIAKHFQPETIRLISGYDYMLDANPQDPMEFEGIVQLLRDDTMRDYRIDIETDSTVAVDEEAEKAAMNEFLGSVGGFMQTAIPTMQNAPALAPMMKEFLLMTARKYKAGRSLETVLDNNFEAYIQQLNQPPQPPPPDPAMVKAQNDMQLSQAQMQADMQLGQQKLAQDMQIATQKLEGDSIKLQQEATRWQAEFELKAREVKGKHEVDLAKLSLEVEKINKELELKATEIQQISIERDMQNQQALKDEANSKIQKESSGKAPAINITNVMPSGNKKITLSGPPENRTGTIEDVGGDSESNEGVGADVE